MIERIEGSTERIITLPALMTTAGFIILDLVGVGIIGDAAAKSLGFDSSWLMPVSALICIAAGYAATRRGMWGATAGSMMSAVEMIAYLVTGDRVTGVVPKGLESKVTGFIILGASLAGALLGAVGGWIAHRRAPVVATTTTRPV